MARRLLEAPVLMSNVAFPSRASRGHRASAARAARAARRAFTLIELMIVVAIVGILAVIAVVGYRKLVLVAKVTEAKNVISGARIAQEGYRTERGIYANIGPALCPLAASGTGQFKTGWDPTCGGGPTWAVLPIHVDGPVQFGYATIAGSTGLPTTIGQPTAFVTVPAAVGTDPWYYVTASADLDGNGGMYTELVGTSWQNTIFVFQEGE
jgi:type IV pilus assembly protein PilA